MADFSKKNYTAENCRNQDNKPGCEKAKCFFIGVQWFNSLLMNDVRGVHHLVPNFQA